MYFFHAAQRSELRDVLLVVFILILIECFDFSLGRASEGHPKPVSLTLYLLRLSMLNLQFRAWANCLDAYASWLLLLARLLRLLAKGQRLGFQCRGKFIILLRSFHQDSRLP